MAIRSGHIIGCIAIDGENNGPRVAHCDGSSSAMPREEPESVDSFSIPRSLLPTSKDVQKRIFGFSTALKLRATYTKTMASVLPRRAKALMELQVLEQLLSDRQNLGYVGQASAFVRWILPHCPMVERCAQPVMRFSTQAIMAYMTIPSTASIRSPANTNGTLNWLWAELIMLPRP